MQGLVLAGWELPEKVFHLTTARPLEKDRASLADFLEGIDH